jgi:hypothetical protein
MRDVLFLLVIVGFFAVAAALVAACDRIVGPDPSPAASSVAPEAVER